MAIIDDQMARQRLVAIALARTRTIDNISWPGLCAQDRLPASFIIVHKVTLIGLDNTMTVFEPFVIIGPHELRTAVRSAVFLYSLSILLNSTVTIRPSTADDVNLTVASDPAPSLLGNI
jgi:hypothetical protein